MAEAAKKATPKMSDATREHLVKALMAHMLALHAEKAGGGGGAAQQQAAPQQAAPQQAMPQQATPQMPNQINIVHHMAPAKGK